LVDPDAMRALNERLLAAIGEHTNAAIGRMTGLNSEMVRHYRRGKAPSCRFLMLFTSRMGVSADWLLHGRGPMHVRARRPSSDHPSPPCAPALCEPKPVGPSATHQPDPSPTPS